MSIVACNGQGQLEAGRSMPTVRIDQELVATASGYLVNVISNVIAGLELREHAREVELVPLLKVHHDIGITAADTVDDETIETGTAEESVVARPALEHI